MPSELPERAGSEPSFFSADDFGAGNEAEIGDFRQGSPLSQWALARYLVGRSLGVSIGNNLLGIALVLLGVGALLQWTLHTTFWAIVVTVLALIVLGMRALVRALLNNLTAANRYGPLEDRLRSLVSDTRKDVLAELRRVGLPGRPWSLPLLAVRLSRPSRRRETLDKLRNFDLDRAVAPARVDELHHIMRAAFQQRGAAA